MLFLSKRHENLMITFFSDLSCGKNNNNRVLSRALVGYGLPHRLAELIYSGSTFKPFKLCGVIKFLWHECYISAPIVTYHCKRQSTLKGLILVLARMSDMRM